MNAYREKYLDIAQNFFGEGKIENNLEVISRIIHDTIVENMAKYKNVAIWGAGEHTDNLMKYFSVQFKDLKYIIENNVELANQKYAGYKIIEGKDIDKWDIDCIIISSFTFRKKVSEQIEKITKNIKIVDFYDVLEEENIILPAPFYMLADEYININKLIMNFNNGIGNRKDTIFNIILNYAKIYDFKNLFKFIDILVHEFPEEAEKTLKFKNELIGLFDSLGKTLKLKKDNIILLYIDALRDIDVNILKKMPYIKEIADKNINFTNAFSTSVTTYESMISCLSGQMPLENENYKRNFIEEDECEFVKEGIKKGYEISFYVFGHDRFINSENIRYKPGGTYCATTLWNFITDLAEQKGKGIYLIYFMQESHPPHIGGEHSSAITPHVTPFRTVEQLNQTQDEYSEQYYEAIRYLDEQLKFFINMINEDNSIIVFSDHGQIIEKSKSDIKSVGTLLGWHDEKYKIPFIVKDKRLKPEQIDSLFSLIDLNKVVVGLMNGELNLEERDFVEMQFSTVHNIIIRKFCEENGLEDYINGFEVYRNKEYKVAKINNKKLRVYDLANGEVEINEEEKKEEIIKKYFDEI